jgi:hypothetical protein
MYVTGNPNANLVSFNIGTNPMTSLIFLIVITCGTSVLSGPAPAAQDLEGGLNEAGDAAGSRVCGAPFLPLPLVRPGCPSALQPFALRAAAPALNVQNLHTMSIIEHHVQYSCVHRMANPISVTHDWV